MTGYCKDNDHEHCPDTTHDNYICECPCHLESEVIYLRPPSEDELAADRNN